MQPKTLAGTIGLALVGFAAIGSSAQAAPGHTELVSVVAAGTRAAGDSNLRHGGGTMSADGRYVAFHSYRASLAAGDDNGVADVFLRDLQLGVTRLVSTSVDGSVANAYSVDASLSADGRLVAFFSPADDLLHGDRNGAGDIFVWHRESGRIELASVATGGGQGNDTSLESAIGADGRYIAFTSFASNLVRNDTNGHSDIFLRDRQGGYTERVSVASDGRQANGFSWQPCVSADGRHVAFYSTATNLVPGGRDGLAHVFVRDRQTRQTLRVSAAADGTPANGYNVQPALSGNGRYVAFVSTATNLVPGDTNGLIDVFVKDLQNGRVERVSVASTGGQGNGGSYEPALSADGRYVVFESFAANLVPGDTNVSHDVFMHDRETRQTRRVSVGTGETQPDAASWTPSLSADGRFVAFRSDATNLATGDGNRSSDVYVRDLGPNGSSKVAFTIKPSALDFGSRPVGTSTTQDFWLRNRSAMHLPIEAMTLRGPGRAAYDVAHTCGTLVAPDQVCRLSVTFHPTAAGSMSAELEVHAAGDVVRTRELAGVAAR